MIDGLTSPPPPQTFLPKLVLLDFGDMGSMPEVVTEVPERVEEEPAPPARVEPAKQQVTEEDLEDWLDSMIS